MNKKILIGFVVLMILEQSSFVCGEGQESHGIDEVLAEFENGASDLIGFSVPEMPSSPQFLNNQTLFSLPMFPIFQNNHYQGVIIPREFVAPQFKMDAGGMFITSNPHGNSLMGRAFEQVRAMGLSPISYNGDVYGVSSNVEYLHFGEVTTYGISIDLSSWFSSNSLDLVERKGFAWDPTKNFQNLVLKTQAFFYTKSPYETLREMADILPYVRLSMYHYAFNGKFKSQMKSQVKPIAELIPIEFSKNFHLDLPYREDKLMVSVDPSDFKSSLNRNIQRMNDPREIQIERFLNNEIKPMIDSQMVVNHPEYERQLHKLCDHIALAMHVPTELSPTCRISASFVPNAYAFPGGDIFVTAGLIGVLENVGALSFVLAHEISHVMASHGRHLGESSKFSNFILLTLGWAGQVYSWGGGLGNFDLGNDLSNIFGASQASNLALNVSYLSILASLLSYNRSQEEEADHMGHEGALASGFSQLSMVNGWERFMEHMQAYYPMEKSLKNIIFATHPKGEDRLNELKKRYSTSIALTNKYFENGIGLDQVFEYGKMHRYFKSHMTPYLEYVMEQNKQGKISSSSFSLYEDLMMPTNACVLHALGAVPPLGFFERIFGGF